MTEELDELERRIREKWGTDLVPQSSLQPEDRAIAEKLLGKPNAERLARTPKGQRFKYRAPVVTAQYYYRPGMGDEFSSFPGCWEVTVIVDGRKRVFATKLDQERCMFVVREMKKRSIPVRDLGGYVTPVQAPKTAQPSRRKAALDQIGKIRS